MRNSETELKECIGVRTLPDGTNVEFPMLVDSLCFKYPELKGAVIELGQVLTEIENFDPALYKSVKVSKSLQGERGAKSKRGTALDYEKIDLVLNTVYRANASVSSVISWFHGRWQEEFDALDLPSDSSLRKRIKENFTK
jgi:hypothetical protein